MTIVGSISSANRPICVYALANLKRNSTRLLIAMCIGIGLALYGAYVASRMRSSVRYTPTIQAATSWFNERLAHTLGHPMSKLTGGASCSAGQTNQALYRTPLTRSKWILDKIVRPFVTSSGLINLLINISQIVLLKIYSMSGPACDAIVGLSIGGLVVSGMCMFGALMTCKTMCLSCLGIHHAVIIYFALKRRTIIHSMLCPSGPGSTGNSNNNTSSSSTGTNTSCPTLQTANKMASNIPSSALKNRGSVRRAAGSGASNSSS